MDIFLDGRRGSRGVSYTEVVQFPDIGCRWGTHKIPSGRPHGCAHFEQFHWKGGCTFRSHFNFFRLISFRVEGFLPNGSRPWPVSAALLARSYRMSNQLQVMASSWSWCWFLKEQSEHIATHHYLCKESKRGMEAMVGESEPNHQILFPFQLILLFPQPPSLFPKLYELKKLGLSCSLKHNHAPLWENPAYKVRRPAHRSSRKKTTLASSY